MMCIYKLPMSRVGTLQQSAFHPSIRAIHSKNSRIMQGTRLEIESGVPWNGVLGAGQRPGKQRHEDAFPFPGLWRTRDIY